MLFVNDKHLNIQYVLFGDRLNDNYYRSDFKPLLNDLLLTRPFTYIIPHEPLMWVSKFEGGHKYSATLRHIAFLLLFLNQGDLLNKMSDRTYYDFLRLTRLASRSYKRIFDLYIKKAIEHTVSNKTLAEIGAFLAGPNNMTDFKNTIRIPDTVINRLRSRIQNLDSRIPIFVPNDIDIIYSVQNEFDEDPLIEVVQKVLSVLNQIAEHIFIAGQALDFAKQYLSNFADVISRAIKGSTTTNEQSDSQPQDFEFVIEDEGSRMDILSTALAILYFAVHQRVTMLPKVFARHYFNSSVTLKFSLIAETPEQILDNIYIPLAYFSALSSPIKLNLRDIVGEIDTNSMIGKFVNAIVEVVNRGPFALQPLYLTLIIPGKIFIPFGGVSEFRFTIDDDTSFYGGHPKKVDVELTIQDLSNGVVMFMDQSASNNTMLRSSPGFAGMLMYDNLKKHIIEAIMATDNYGINSNERGSLLLQKITGNVYIANSHLLDLKNNNAFAEKTNKDTPLLQDFIERVIKLSDVRGAMSIGGRGVSTCRGVSKDRIIDLSRTDSLPDLTNDPCNFSTINSGAVNGLQYKCVKGIVGMGKKNITKDSIHNIMRGVASDTIRFYRTNATGLRNNPILLNQLEYHLNSGILPYFMVCQLKEHAKARGITDKEAIYKMYLMSIINLTRESRFKITETSVTGATGMFQVIQRITNQRVNNLLYPNQSPAVSRTHINRCIAMDPFIAIYNGTQHIVETYIYGKGDFDRAFLLYTGKPHADAAAKRASLAKQLYNNQKIRQEFEELYRGCDGRMTLFRGTFENLIEHYKQEWPKKHSGFVSVRKTT
ncbi:MAG: hypothetical protein QXW35_04205 [Candidatus Aenigmatarchaeota archaeon]